MYFPCFFFFIFIFFLCDLHPNPSAVSDPDGLRVLLTYFKLHASSSSFAAVANLSSKRDEMSVAWRLQLDELEWQNSGRRSCRLPHGVRDLLRQRDEGVLLSRNQTDDCPRRSQT